MSICVICKKGFTKDEYIDNISWGYKDCCSYSCYRKKNNHKKKWMYYDYDIDKNDKKDKIELSDDFINMFKNMSISDKEIYKKYNIPLDIIFFIKNHNNKTNIYVDYPNFTKIKHMLKKEYNKPNKTTPKKDCVNLQDDILQKFKLIVNKYSTKSIIKLFDLDYRTINNINKKQCTTVSIKTYDKIINGINNQDLLQCINIQKNQIEWLIKKKNYMV